MFSVVQEQKFQTFTATHFFFLRVCVLSHNGQWRIINVSIYSGLKYEELLERKTDVYVKLMVITFVTRDMVLLVVSVINIW